MASILITCYTAHTDDMGANGDSPVLIQLILMIWVQTGIDQLYTVHTDDVGANRDSPVSAHTDDMAANRDSPALYSSY
jgi:hypothetical protein